MIKLYNTFYRKKQVFKPLKSSRVTIYDCGPTVYFYAHIGNMWRYLVSDLLRRTLEYHGFEVKQVMNITDVGHLTQDDLLAADTGEDRMVLAAKREKKTPQQIARFYTKAFFRDRQKLNILAPHIVCKATDHIPDMIRLIKVLEKKRYAYWAGPKYFVYDISRFKRYGSLSGKKLKDLRAGARLEPIPEKKNPFDFALWIKDEKHLMRWSTPWGVGYPGWHIECSAMSMRYLGKTLDIHTGGEDNIFPHHENEIAQSEAVTGQKFVRYWLHVRHNLVEGQKMSKSKGNVFLLQGLIDKGFNPLSYRYLCLNNHYRNNLNFSWQALRASQRALDNLYQMTEELRSFIPLLGRPSQKRDNLKGKNYRERNPRGQKYQRKFSSSISDDLNLPQALAVTWKMLKDKKLDSLEKYQLLLDFDRVLGLGLSRVRPFKAPQEAKSLAKEREKFRQKGDFGKADRIRKEIERLGFKVDDTLQGPEIKPKR